MEDRVAANTTGLTRRHSTGLVLLAAVITLLFLLLYVTARRVVINEVRSHAMGVAIAAAAILDPDKLDAVQGPADRGSAAFESIQQTLGHVAMSNPDVRFIYTMRRSDEPFAPVGAFEFVVDQAAHDHNHDGKLTRDEESELPGTPYDATGLPELVAAWDRPGADLEITPDPPYPDLISGYAPVKNGEGRTRAIVGVDITASTVATKLLTLRVVTVLVWAVMLALVLLVAQLYYRQRDAYDRIKHLNEELAARNELLKKANEQLATMEDEELSLRRGDERGARLVFDTYYLKAALRGPAVSDVFDIDDDHVGVFLADAGGHHVAAALLSGLLKMAVAASRDAPANGTSTWYADLACPGEVLKSLNDLLVREIPQGQTVNVLYGAIDMVRNQLVFSGTQGMSVCRKPGSEPATAADGHALTDAPLGVAEGTLYRESSVPLRAGDSFFLVQGMSSETVVSALQRVVQQGISSSVQVIHEAVAGATKEGGRVRRSVLGLEVR